MSFFRFDITYLLPASTYSVNNFTVSYIHCSHDLSVLPHLNEYTDAKCSTIFSVTILILGQITNISYRTQDAEKNLKSIHNANGFASFSKTFEQTDLDPRTTINSILNRLIKVQSVPDNQLLFLEAEYV